MDEAVSCCRWRMIFGCGAVHNFCAHHEAVSITRLGAEEPQLECQDISTQKLSIQDDFVIYLRKNMTVDDSSLEKTKLGE